jgi:16S rRNA pseudouridine516 synthase
MTPTTMSGEPDGGTGGGSPEAERLQKYVARCGVTSRRGAEAMIAEGRVAVDGVTVTEAGIKVDPGRQTVTVDDVAIAPPSEHWYVMLNKPAGVVTTLDDPQGRPTVATFIPPGAPRMFPIGRLDAATTGLLLLTNDGQWSRRLTLPGSKLPKVYLVETAEPIGAEYVETFARGIYFAFEDLTTQPAHLELLDSHSARLTLTEGRYHQVKRMFGHFRNRVTALHRESIGPIHLDPTLHPGQHRPLSAEEIACC